MTKPIADKAEVALEYKCFVGTFERLSRFEAHLDPTGFARLLERPGLDTLTNQSICTSTSAFSLTS